MYLSCSSHVTLCLFVPSCKDQVASQTLRNKDRTVTPAKLLSDKVSLHEQRAPASFIFKQSLPVQSLHSLCSVASSSLFGFS
jgi:hypothetical protein